jgi:ribonuclease R
MNGAIDGDLVELAVDSRISGKGPEGAIISILERGRSHLVATVIETTAVGAWLYSAILGQEQRIFVASNELELYERVLVVITNWDGTVQATVKERFGSIEDPSIDIACVTQEHHISTLFPLAAIEEAQSFPLHIPELEKQRRRDLTHLESVTIDPDTAKDFDDAISLTQDEQGHYHLGVHIADVAHYVTTGSTLDLEAKARCNSVYFPGCCIPMLPEALSNELCSLKPNVDRLTQSVLVEFSQEGEALHVQIVRSVIRSRKRLTYTEALEILENRVASPHAPLLYRMKKLCFLLKQRRMERGSIDFAMTERVIRVDDRGAPTHLETIEYDITHQMIEEFMLKANELVAAKLDQQNISLIFRVHEEPSADNFQDFYSLVRILGFTLPKSPETKDLQALFQKAKDSPFFHQLSVSFIRSMKQALYSPENIGHYGLALSHYCHFTSPIRRYTDLIIQRLLFNEMDPSTDIAAVASSCSEKERKAMRAESQAVLLKKLRLARSKLQSTPDQIYEATITRVKPFALFFDIKALDLEGSFHVSELGEDYFEYHAPSGSLRGARTGKTFSLGQTLSVKLDHVDLIYLKSDWSSSLGLLRSQSK